MTRLCRTLALLVLVAACGGDGDSGATARAGGALTGDVTVLAAASLTEPFSEIGRRFEAANPGTGVNFSFDASSTLSRQAREGVPADVLATADEVTMQQAVDAAAVASPAVFAHNRLAIVVAKGNPRGVRSLADLARPGLVVVLCAPEVPCGRFGRQALARAGATVQPRSFEPTVKGVVAKVTLGEADAGIVYASDVQAAGAQVDGVAIAPEHNVVATYPIATLRSPRNPAAADAFVAFVLSPEGQAVLVAAGFDAGP